MSQNIKGRHAFTYLPRTADKAHKHKKSNRKNRKGWIFCFLRQKSLQACFRMPVCGSLLKMFQNEASFVFAFLGSEHVALPRLASQLQAILLHARGSIFG